MRYCTRCVQPDTRPGIFFPEDGVCGACLWAEEKKTINWTEREKELHALAEEARRKAKTPYTCVIGVSGGKDSTFQALYARDRLGLRPLLVSGEPEGMTELGRKNIENLKQLGFDVISLRPNPKVMRRLIRRNFLECLNPVRPTEYPLWASAYLIAVQFNIPLIIQGENAGQTLGVSLDTGTGGDALSVLRLNTLQADPMEAFVSDGVTKDDLFMYAFRPEDLFERDIKAIWLSYYAKEWSEPGNASFSMTHGLQIRSKDSDPYQFGTYRFYSALDSSLVSVNQLFKYIKFGFGWTTDHVCYDIREGLITREEGIYLVRELDGKCGDVFIENFCAFIGITKEAFWNHANIFRGPMWEKITSEEWRLNNPVWEQQSIQGKYSVREIMDRLEDGKRCYNENK